MRAMKVFITSGIRLVPAVLQRAAVLGFVLLWAPVAQAEQERTFVFKPLLLSPPPERVAPLDQQRALTYRHKLQLEIRRLETRRDRSEPRAANRLGRARGELSRIRRSTRR